MLKSHIFESCLVRGTGRSPSFPYFCIYTAHQSGLILCYCLGRHVIAYVSLGNRNVHVILGRRILDEKSGVQGEECPSPFGSVCVVTGLWNKSALLVPTYQQPTHVTRKWKREPALSANVAGDTTVRVSLYNSISMWNTPVPAPFPTFKRLASSTRAVVYPKNESRGGGGVTMCPGRFCSLSGSVYSGFCSFFCKNKFLGCLPWSVCQHYCGSCTGYGMCCRCPLI